MLQRNRLFRNLRIMAIFTLIVIASLWYLLSIQAPITPAMFVKSSQIQSFNSQEIENVLSSHIPAYTSAADHVFLEETPLRRVQLQYVNEEDDGAYDASLVLLDKVIVIPKDLRK